MDKKIPESYNNRFLTYMMNNPDIVEKNLVKI